jgi:hypothetical protein
MALRRAAGRSVRLPRAPGLGRRRSSRPRVRRLHRWSRARARRDTRLVAVEGAALRTTLEDPRRVEPPDDVLLVLVREDHVRSQEARCLAERLDAAVANRAPRREVEADPRAFLTRELRRAQRGAPHRLDNERVAGDVQVRATGEPRRLDLVRTEIARRPPVGGHRALALRRDEGADRPVAAEDRAADLDAELRQPLAHEHARVVGAGLPDEPRRRAELARPGSDVRGLAARADADLRVRVAAGRDRRSEPDDDVQREISERADEHGEGDRKIRTWTAASGVAGCERSSSEGSSAHRPPSRRSTGAVVCNDAGAVRAGSRRSRALRATSSCSSASATSANRAPTSANRAPTSASLPGHCADLRVSLPQRAHVRALPEDVRPALGDLRRVRCRTG